MPGWPATSHNCCNELACCRPQGRLGAPCKDASLSQGVALLPTEPDPYADVFLKTCQRLDNRISAVGFHCHMQEQALDMGFMRARLSGLASLHASGFLMADVVAQAIRKISKPAEKTPSGTCVYQIICSSRLRCNGNTSCFASKY